jgi:uncharacterized protein (DUF4415 family)
MTVNRHVSKASSKAKMPVLDPADDAPELTEAWFATADLMMNGEVIRRGRPRGESNKVAVSIRLSPEVVEFFRGTGPGWQTRIDDVLRRSVRARRGR